MPFGRPLFTIAFPGADTTESVRRSLARMDRTSPGLVKMRAVCDQLKLKCESPFGIRDSWAHLAIPSKKIVVFMRQSTDTSLFRRVKEGWEEKGWITLFITNRHADQVSEDELAAHLKDALQFVREAKR